MPGQHLKGKICGQAISRDNVDEIKSCLPNVLKNGAEILTSADSFEATVKILGRTVVGNVLSEISLTQCSGLVGVILSTVAPEV